ncbi:hypothetical protein C8T65DRAFT_297645 [Cerioporus squamosus]|nr:hypothetical protein C8T65DRAFT_297645 [Cerioporus squamosus]
MFVTRGMASAAAPRTWKVTTITDIGSQAGTTAALHLRPQSRNRTRKTRMNIVQDGDMYLSYARMVPWPTNSPPAPHARESPSRHSTPRPQYPRQPGMHHLGQIFFSTIACPCVRRWGPTF